MLNINNISKKYGNVEIIKDFSLECNNNGITAIMGPSGVGKTTLLNIIANVEKADVGSIDTSFKKISYKFQEPRLLNWLTAEENILIVTEKGENALNWLSKVGLLESASKYPNELSGGMQQRVALARALAFCGDLLLLDEPFNAVDTETKQSLIDIIKEYAVNHTVILVTHDINEAIALNARIVTLK